MIAISVLVLIFFAHWVADFVCQIDWMARNKSKSNHPLFVHVLVYSFILGLFLIPIQFNYLLVYFVLLNGFLHFCTDWCTSRISSKLYAKGKLGSDSIPNFGFFSVIGFDQFIHMATIVITYGLIFNG